MANPQINNGISSDLSSSPSTSLQNVSERNRSEPSYAEKAKKAASDASDQISRLATDASDRVATAYDGATSAVGRRMVDTGSKLESSDIVQRTGRRMNEVGSYLERAKLEDISEYTRSQVRRNPLAAVAIGIGAGVLIGRWISK